jgi:hypothetical protein
MLERRFDAGFRETAGNDPGLVQEADGSVWYVKPDGSRVQVGGGGSLPAGGTTGQVLTKASDVDGDADWEAVGGAGFSGASFSLLGSQGPYNVGTSQLVSWEVAAYDTDGYIAVLPSATIIIPAQGYYLVEANCSGFDDAGIDGAVYYEIKYDATGIVPPNVGLTKTQTLYNGISEDEFDGQVIGVASFPAGTTMGLQVSFHTFGAGTTWTIQDSFTSLTVTKIG